MIIIRSTQGRQLRRIVGDAHTLVARWGPRVTFSIVDQALFSGANFFLNVLLARWLPLAEYGAFVLAFSIYLFIAGFHSAFILEPMAVIGVKYKGNRGKKYIRNLFGIHVLLTVCSSVVMALALLHVHDRLLGLALLGVIITLPFLLLFWLARRINYLDVRVERAAFGSGLYSVLVLLLTALLWKLSWITAMTAFFALGVASLVASILSLGSLRIGQPTTTEERAPIPITAVIAEHWRYGKWAILTAGLSLLTTQLQMFLIAAMTGLEDAGAIRALLNFILPMAQVVTAIGILGLPIVAADYHAGRMLAVRRKCLNITMGLTGIAIIYEMILIVLSGPIERIAYGGQFSERAWLIPVLGLIPVFAALASGFSIELRATQRPKIVMIANALAAPLAIGFSVGLIHVWGLPGAAASLSMAYGLIAAITLWLYQRACAVVIRTRASAPMADESNRQPLRFQDDGWIPHASPQSTALDEIPQVRS